MFVQWFQLEQKQQTQTLRFPFSFFPLLNYTHKKKYSQNLLKKIALSQQNHSMMGHTFPRAYSLLGSILCSGNKDFPVFDVSFPSVFLLIPLISFSSWIEWHKLPKCVGLRKELKHMKPFLFLHILERLSHLRDVDGKWQGKIFSFSFSKSLTPMYLGKLWLIWIGCVKWQIQFMIPQ